MDNFDRAYLQELAYKWKNKQLTEAEQQYLAHWEASQLDNLLVLPNDAATPEAIKKRMLNKLLNELAAENTPAKKTIQLWPRIIGAAAAVAAITFGVWFYTANNTARHLDDRRDLLSYANDIAPGGNRATLTSNGKSINLSGAKTGVVVGDDIKYTDGSAVGSLSPMGRDGEAREGEFKTLTTPKGGTYSIILQDGTKVWLNADSKLEFLSNYRNKLQRIVKLTGEAYFEVAPAYTTIKGTRARQRFIVQSKGQRVEVLGTHFNISAYNAEVIKTTLLEGSVRIEGKLMLKPGQQSEISLDRRVTVKQVDVNEAIAWKNNEFMFENQPIEEVMKMVERWYNVTVIYQGDKPADKFGGVVSRFDKISKVLSVLESTGRVHFKVEDRKVYVSK
ncbi:FecR family protein [Pedobacter africanus]|uniref:FecR family protein n=1 Tax=Pedobacter africanus TaxID=151894 RepID=A0A1W2A353_9SPHI|nr:FecR family protein [Pedobacter africanus]SMC54738.1 FecR family protein [Pedobacter africanus]